MATPKRLARHLRKKGEKLQLAQPKKPEPWQRKDFVFDSGTHTLRNVKTGPV